MSSQDKSNPEIQRDRDAMVAGRDVNYFWASADVRGGDESRAILRPPVGRLPAHVRGRGKLLEILSTVVERPDGRVHVLFGLGGTGKSTIALAVADRAIQAGRDVWWITATDPATVNSSLLALASHLGASTEEVESALRGEASPYELLWTRLEARSGWVLILDRADDPLAIRVENSPAANGGGWIRGSESGLLLVTTRNKDPRAWGRSAELHHIGWLSELDGAELLLDLAPDSGTLKQAEHLCERLGGLPLALHTAGAYLAHNRITFERYEMRLRQSGSIDSVESGDRKVIERTFELSLEMLDRDGQHGARKLMESLCWFDGGTPVPARHLDSQLLAYLYNIGLIDGQADTANRIGEWVVVHPLAAESLRGLMTDRARADTAAAAAVSLLEAQTDDLTPDDKQQWYAWLPHVESMLTLAATRLGKARLSTLLGIAAQLTRALSWAGDYVRLNAVVDTALSEAVRLDRDDSSVISLNMAKARAFEVEGDHPRAEALMRDIVPMLDRLFGPDHPDSLSARFDLARVLAAEGRLDESEALLRRVLEVQVGILGPEHPRSLMTESELADVLLAQHRYAECESLLRSLYDTQLRVMGAASPDTAYTLLRLGVVSAETGRYAQAQAIFQESKDKFSRIFGVFHRATWDASYGLAATLSAQGDYPAARIVLRDLLDIQRTVLPPADPVLVRTVDLLRAVDNEAGGGAAARE